MKLTGIGPSWRDTNGTASPAYKAAIERIPGGSTEEPDEE
jgi:hypothetical protein